MDRTVAKFFWAEVRRLTTVKLPVLHPLTWAHDLIDSALFPPRDAASCVACGRYGWEETNADMAKHLCQCRWR
jgi:hypothetical protein